MCYHSGGANTVFSYSGDGGTGEEQDGLVPVNALWRKYKTKMEKGYEYRAALGTRRGKEPFVEAGVSYETGVSAYVAGGIRE